VTPRRSTTRRRDIENYLDESRRSLRGNPRDVDPSVFDDVDAVGAPDGFVAAFSLFAGMELILGVLSFALFRTELPSCAPRVLPDGSRRGVPFEQSLVGSNLLTHSLRWFLR
jgi:hypothetical protein